MPYVWFNTENEDFDGIIQRRPTAFVLLAVIVRGVARNRENEFSRFDSEQTIISSGNYKVTEQVYRSDKEFLEKYGIATFEGTNEGTIATITGTDVFVCLDVGTSGNIESTEQEKENQEKESLTEEELEEKGHQVLEIFNRVQGRAGPHKFTSIKGFKSNLEYWLEDYTLDDIERAVKNSLKDKFWRDACDPVTLLRRKNQRQEPVDWIGHLKGMGGATADDTPLSKKKVLTEEEMEELMREHGAPST